MPRRVDPRSDVAASQGYPFMQRSSSGDPGRKVLRDNCRVARHTALTGARAGIRGDIQLASSWLLSVVRTPQQAYGAPVNRRTLVVGLAATALACLAATGCDEPDQVHIILAEPFAGRGNPAGSERVLDGARVRLRQHGFVHQAGTAPAPDGERWLWHEGRADALETRLASSDEGITITLRQVKGERGPEFQMVLNKLSGVVSACMAAGASPPVSPQARP